MKSSVCALTLAAACLISTLDLTSAYHKTVRCIPGTGTVVPPQLANDNEEPDYRRRALLRTRRLYTKVRYVDCGQPDASASTSAHTHGDGEGEGYRILYQKDHHDGDEGEGEESHIMGGDDEGEIPPMAQMDMAKQATPDERGVAEHG